MLDFLVYHTENGTVYAYIKGCSTKKILYNNGKSYFVKNNGENIIFNEDDNKRINDFINN